MSENFVDYTSKWKRATKKSAIASIADATDPNFIAGQKTGF
jgi:hypothetical protein